jgi:hypothetical protein
MYQNSILSDFLLIAYINSLITFNDFIKHRNSLNKPIDIQKELLRERFDEINTFKLGQSGFLPFLMINQGNKNEQKEFLIGLKTEIGKNNFWNYIQLISENNLENLSAWSVKIFILSKKGKKRKEISKNLLKDNKSNLEYFKLENRNETNLRIQLVIENIPYYFELLINSIILDLETDRGDIISLKFTDFFYTSINDKIIFQKELGYQDQIIFKIDSGYRMEPSAILTFSNINIVYEDFLIPKTWSPQLEIIKNQLDFQSKMILKI